MNNIQDNQLEIKMYSIDWDWHASKQTGTQTSTWLTLGRSQPERGRFMTSEASGIPDQVQQQPVAGGSGGAELLARASSGQGPWDPLQEQ